MGYRIGPVGTGTVSGTSGTQNVTGSGSAFNTQFASGDAIILIDSGGNHDSYIVDSVTNDTALTVTTNLAETYSGVSYYGQRDASEMVKVLGTELDPSSTYKPGGARVITGKGTALWRGYPVSVWSWGWMTITEWTAFKTYVLGGEYSAECYVETRDDDDSYSRYLAVIRLPDTSGIERWGERYLNVQLEFSLVSAVA